MSLLLINALFHDKQIANIYIEGERIVEIGDNEPDADHVIDLQGLLVLPGMIDVHAHLRDMELAYKEDWLSGSQAAAAGGVTTIFDMPNTKPATFDKSSLAEKRKAAQKSVVNYGFNFGINKYNLNDVRAAEHIAAIKMFMAESSSGRVVEGSDLIAEIFELSREIDKPVIVHSELQSCVESYERRFPATIDNHNNIRNRECAIKSTEILIKLAREAGNRLYLAHISTAEEIELIRQAKAQGTETIFCEITPHHLLINEDILKTVGNHGKVNPPLRTAQDNQALLEGIRNGTVDTIGSDHAPHSLGEKSRAYPDAPSGFPGFETTMPLLLNEAYHERLSVDRIVELTAYNPSQIFRIKDRGHIIPGAYADLVAVDPGRQWVIDPSKFFTKAMYSPFKGLNVHGKVSLTVVNGHVVYHNEVMNAWQGKEVEFR